MKFYIKNMVCSRCKMVVKNQFQSINLHPTSVELGEVDIEQIPSALQTTQLKASLTALGF